MKKYEKLRNQYPEHISLDQLRVICKIAKRSARHLVKSGIIPAVDTGQKTWRYRIAIDDVIAYLYNRDCKGKAGYRKPSTRRSYSQVVAYGEEREVVKYFADIYADYPDAITTDDMATMTGMHKKSFLRILKEGKIKFLESSSRYIVPKVYFWEFIASRRFIDAWSHTSDFIRILEGFETWRNQQKQTT